MNKFYITLIMLFHVIPYSNAQELKYKRQSNHSHLSIKVERNTLMLSGRKIELDKNGFPKQIQSFFSSDLTALTNSPNNLLYENIHFHFVRQKDGKNTVLKDGGVQFLKQTDKKVRWESINQNDSLMMEVSGKLYSDGFLTYAVKIKALQDIDLKDVTMHIPFNTKAADNMVGFGIKEGGRPEKVEWIWNGSRKEAGAWIGSSNAGLQYTLEKGSWDNESKGGVTIGIKGGSMLANNYVGPHLMKKGEIKHYNFNLLITPLQLVKLK